MKGKSLFTLLILPVIWGTYYVANHEAVSMMSTFTVGIVIRFVTMILLTIIMLARKQLHELLHVQYVLPRLFIIGTLGFLLDVTAFMGLQRCPAGIGTVLLKCDVLFVNLISAVVYHYKFSKKDWLYTFIMLFGVVLVLDIDFSELGEGGFGYIFFILSALFVSINAFVIKSAQHDARNPVSDNVVAYYNNFVTMLYFIGFALFSNTIGELGMVGKDAGLTTALMIASVGQTLVYVVYYYNLRRYEVWLVKVFLLLMPIVSTVISFIVFHETIGLMQLAGMAVVLLGAAGVIVEQGKKGSQPAAVSDK